MATSGWYPDPGGAPGRFRYWDGTAWSAGTTDDPSAPPPPSGPPAPPPSRRRGGPLIAVLVLVAVIGLVLVLVIRNATDDNRLVNADPPESTVSGWDDSSPLPTAPPSPTGGPTSSDPQGQVSCEVGDPAAHVDHPVDGRIHGGGLSFPDPGGVWSDGQSYAYGMSWTYDANGVDRVVEPGWWALLAVGALHKDDGFGNPKKAAAQVMQCIASSGYYSYFESQTQLHSRAVTVDGVNSDGGNSDGVRGWSIRSEIRVDKPDLEAEGDVVEVIVVDNGVPNQLSVFCGFVTIGAADQIATLDATIADLRVE